MFGRSISLNLRNLLRLSGRETPGEFWPYALVIFALSIGGMGLAMVSEMNASMARMQRFAAAHPDQATVISGPGQYSVSIHGNHPELMPHVTDMIGGIAIVLALFVALLGAAVARRLHDRGRTGLRGMVPVVLLFTGLLLMAHIFASPQPDMGLFLIVFMNNLIYLGSLFVLVLQLIFPGEPGQNRFGPSSDGRNTTELA